MPAHAQIAENTLIARAEIAASRELLWRYVSTAQGLACWQADAVHGDLEAGQFSLRWPDLGARLDLSVAEVDHGRRIVLRAGSTSLDLTVADGTIELVHRGLDSDDDLEGFESSWLTALSLLEVGATLHPRKARSVRWLFEQVESSAELLHCYYTEAAALSTWLGSVEHDFAERDAYRLDLFGGHRLSGNVLFAKRDVCLKVSEWNDGILAMRSLPGPENKRVAALGMSTWEEALSPNIIPLLKGALHRLSSTTKSRES